MKGKIKMQEKIIEIIAEIAMLEPENIDIDSRFLDLGIDVLDISEIMMSVEDIADVEIEDYEGFETIRELVEFVKDNM